jgi:ribosome maturation factor RimP
LVAGKDVEARITALLEPEAPRHGLELVAVEVVGTQRHPTVRVYLDRDGGIDIDAIAEANRWVSDLLDADDPIEAGYVLEVSSPGIERPLVKLADYERHIGSEAHVRTSAKVEGRNRFTGTITAVEGDTIVLADGEEAYRLPHPAIAKARLKVDIDL